MRIGVLLGLAFIAGPALAEGDWVRLDQAAAVAALADRELVYEDGASQVFRADGATIYTSAGGPSQGSWAIREGQYCSVWPPSDRWACYDLAQSADGVRVRFTAEDGSATVGTYPDGP